MDLIDVIDNRLLDLQSEMSKLQILKEIEQKKQAPQVEVPLFKLSEKLQRELDSLNSTLRSKLQMEVIVNQFLGTLQLVQHYSDISYTIANYSETEVRAKMERMLGTATTMNPIQYWFNHISGSYLYNVSYESSLDPKDGMVYIENCPLERDNIGYYVPSDSEGNSLREHGSRCGVYNISDFYCKEISFK